VLCCVVCVCVCVRCSVSLSMRAHQQVFICGHLMGRRINDDGNIYDTPLPVRIMNGPWDPTRTRTIGALQSSSIQEISYVVTN